MLETQALLIGSVCSAVCATMLRGVVAFETIPFLLRLCAIGTRLHLASLLPNLTEPTAITIYLVRGSLGASRLRDSKKEADR